MPKKNSKFGQMRNKSSNLEQKLLLKVPSNLEQREYHIVQGLIRIKIMDCAWGLTMMRQAMAFYL
jgi:hypothetical protein